MDGFKYVSLVALAGCSSALITYTYIYWFNESVIAALFFLVPALIGFWLNKNDEMYESNLAHVLHMSKDILLAYIVSAITTLVVVLVS